MFFAGHYHVKRNWLVTFCLLLAVGGILSGIVRAVEDTNQNKQKKSVLESVNNQLKASGVKSGLASETGEPVDPRVATAKLIQVALQVLGMLFIVLIIIGGYGMLTAKGDDSQVEKARKTIQAAIFGLLIILLAYSITWFVGKNIQKAINEAYQTQPFD